VGFGVMGFFIARDARRSRPEVEYAGVRLRDEGPHKHKRQAKAKARAKGRAQRAARKKNR
jgi:prephenate dehydrogenase